MTRAWVKAFLMLVLVSQTVLCRGARAQRPDVDDDTFVHLSKFSPSRNHHLGGSKVGHTNKGLIHPHHNLAEVEDSEGQQSSSSLASTVIGQERVCASCVDRQLVLTFNKEKLREEILRKLNLRAPPNVTMDQVPRHLINQLLERYAAKPFHSSIAEADMMSDDLEPGSGQVGSGVSDYYPGHAEVGGSDSDDDEHFHAKQISIQAQNPESHVPVEMARIWDIQYFALDSPQLTMMHGSNARKFLKKARLFVHLPAAPSVEDDQAWVHLYYVQVSNKNGQVASLTQSKAVRVTLDRESGGWVDIDAEEIVSVWFKYPEENFGLVINAFTKSGESLRVGVQHQTVEVPFLQLELKPLSGQSLERRKRNLHKVCNEETDAAETHCCLWPFTVDFEKEYGWKFVIFPQKYEANFCSGDCSLGVVMPSTPYAHLIQQSNVTPCCTPQKMSGINMLYLDEHHNVILGLLPKMKVERCGCA